MSESERKADDGAADSGQPSTPASGPATPVSGQSAASGFSLNNRFVVVLLTLVLIGAGIVSMVGLPVDAVPDLTNTQVQVLTQAPSLGPVEVEQFITFPVETSLSGIPRVEEIRSLSLPGLSAVTVVFEEGTDIYWARNLVGERIKEARDQIPDGFSEPQMGPIATGLGEIYHFEVRAEPGSQYSVMDLRTILEWQVAYQLRSVPGVIEVNTQGGKLKTYEVQLDPNKLLKYGLSISQVFEALRQNNANEGGGYIAHHDEQQLVRGEALIEKLADIETIVLDSRNHDTPIMIRDVADVRFAPQLRYGAATRDGRGEVVLGTAMLLMGENSRTVARRVDERVNEIQKTLPPGVVIDTFYDRTTLVDRTIATVRENITGGAVLVVIMLFLLLGDLRAGLIVAASIPLSALFMFIAMRLAGVPANLMSLGALDFGIIVDGSVVMVEQIVRRLSQSRVEGPESRDSATEHPSGLSSPDSRLNAINVAAGEVARPILFAGMVVIIVFLPILSLHGIEGKMFRPMAFSFMSALTGALILSVTVIPVMASLFLARNISDRETWLVRNCKRIYAPVLRWSITHPLPVTATAAGVFVASVVVASHFGAEFIPRLDEGDIAMEGYRLQSVSLETSIELSTQIEQTLLAEFPEIRTVVSKIGRPEIATDPMGVNRTDMFVLLKPQDEWQNFDSKDELVEAMENTLAERIPGQGFSFSQPIELRVQELIAGVRADVGISLYGDDLPTLSRKADEIVRAIQQVRGASDVRAEQLGGMAYLRVKVRRDQIARYGINARDVLDAVSIVGGKSVGQVYEGQQRFGLQVRLGEPWREDIDAIRKLRIADPRGRQIPLEQLAEITVEEGPALISRDDVRRRILVQCNVRGRDLASFVAAAQQAVDENVKLPPNYRITWGGQFRNLQEANRRLMIAVPVAMFLIFSLLYMAFKSGRLALLIYLNVPMSATGGIFLLWLRDMPFSISAGVGFIALFGIAVMNGVVLVEHIRDLRKTGVDTSNAIYHGAMDRLRPVLMTATTDALGFLPMALSTSAGAEVQRPLATVVIGGVLTSSLLTLIILPAIYRWFEPPASDVRSDTSSPS
ncbi:CusA/CzcA family heavy metal efflux RND transporter [bacterium]|nr:CusA/CzcA family heavy metal efflux RND transporter [bacterium]